MSFRARLVIAALVVAWVPVLCLGLIVRSAGAGRLAAANDLRMSERGAALAAAWGEDMRELGNRLDGLARLLAGDNEVRVALQEGRGATLGRAVGAFASASGAGVASVVEGDGTILAASHFPGDAGRRDPGLAALADERDAPVVAEVSLPGGNVTAVLRAGRVEVGEVEVVAVVGTRLSELDAVPAGGDVWLLARAVGGGGGERVVVGRPGSPPGSAEIEGRRRIATVVWRGWGVGRLRCRSNCTSPGGIPCAPPWCARGTGRCCSRWRDRPPWRCCWGASWPAASRTRSKGWRRRRGASTWAGWTRASAVGEGGSWTASPSSSTAC